MSSDPDRLDQPPFPPLKWDDCDWWDGEIDLAFGASAGLTVTPYDPSVSRLPSSAQAAALEFQIKNGDRVIQSVLEALRDYYSEQRPRYLSFLGEDAGRLMPDIQEAQQLRELVKLAQVHVHSWGLDGLSFVGLQFGCTWDREHGFGVQMHGDRIVEIGSADASFAWAPDEADDFA
ncbi:hypothetical protein OKA05_18710 [Luteolibacter arcticus]|uniref:DUF6985 domain-containing protein n=1 Tax=Luteolibacter arcticus TaxID=1581411 RepID=A0ABT3GM68_9BACT|nr:hypothetical protein [Luteolibacter arcticus]MCW1924603.1 hypothetical protein [Luteolibacter arcticus]